MLASLAHQFVDIQNPTFKLNDGALSGVHNLNPILTINSISVAPSLLYYGGDAGASVWTPRTVGGSPAGENLVLQAGASPSFHQGSPLLGPYDDSVKFSYGGYYLGTNSSIGDIATEDFVIEMVVTTDGVSLNSYLLTKTATGETVFWLVFWRTGLHFQLQIDDGPTVREIRTATLNTDTWYHIICFVDRSGSAQWYVNREASGSPVDVSTIGTLTNARNLAIGASASGTVPARQSSVAYAAMWKRSAWLDTHLQAAVAKDRFDRLIGLYPQKAEGTASPLVATRNTNAYIPVVTSGGTKRLRRVGPGWLRAINPVDSQGNQLVGYLAEPPATNKILQSENFNNEGVWTQADVGDTWGTQLCVDGDMEAADTSAWLAANNAALTKETATPHDGSRYLRVTHNGTNIPYARQIVLTLGRTYTLSGWYKSDGFAYPLVYLGIDSGYAVQGPSLASWQPFSITRTVFDNRIALCANTSTLGQFCEFDNIKLVELTEEAPNQTLTAFPLIPDATDGVHGFSEVVTLTAAKHTLSVWAKAVGQDWLLLKAEGDPFTAYFNVSTGVVGTMSTADDEIAAIESYGDGWYRCSLTGTFAAGATTVGAYPAAADGDSTFAGDGSTVAMLFWGFQVETGELPTTYVPTLTATASRSADVLTYEGLANVGGVGSDLQGALHFKLLTPDYTPATTRGAFNVVDASDSAASAIYGTCTTADTLALNSLASGGDAGAFGVNADPTDGQIHAVQARWRTDSAQGTMDGVDGAIDTAVDIPDELNNIRVGSTGASNQLGGTIGALRIYKRPTRK